MFVFACDHRLRPAEKQKVVKFQVRSAASCVISCSSTAVVNKIIGSVLKGEVHPTDCHTPPKRLQ